MKQFAIVPNVRAHELLAPSIANVLGPQGFESTKTLCWVRSADAPIRQVFELQKLKGGALIPFWGFSLDFVPHISGSQLKWHRTAKSAVLDYREGFSRTGEPGVPYIWGEGELLRAAPEVLELAFANARALWRAADRLEALPAVFEDFKSRDGMYRHLMQVQIAHAFVLAKTGRPRDAVSELEKYLAPRASAEITAKLRERLAEAAKE